MTILSLENANSFVKIKSPKGEEAYVNTSRQVGEGEEHVLNADSKQAIYKIDGKRYVVGERRDSSNVSSGGRDNDRYSSDRFRVELLIGIARHVENDQKVKLVTGLPATHYHDGVSADRIVKSVKGEHTVHVNGKAKTFEIEDVKVLLQPVGTLMSYLFEEDGTKKRPNEMDTYKAIIDIGWGTTDVAIVDGMKITKTIGVNEAMLDAYRMIRDGIQAEYGTTRGIPSLLFLEEKLRNEDEFTAGGIEYKCGQIKKEAFASTASSIMGKLQNEGITLKDFDKVIFTGGGVTALAEHIGSQLEDVNASRMSEAQLANVKGFYTYGKIKL